MGNPILDSILNKYGSGGNNGLDNSSSPTDTQSGNPILDNILKEYSQPHIAPAPNLSMQGLREINNNIPDVTTPTGYNSPLLPGENPSTPAWFHNIATTLTTPLRAFMNLPFNQRASQAGAEVATGQKFDNTPTTGSTIADTGASLLGGLMGFVANPEGSASNIGATTFNLGQEAAQKILPTALPNVLKAGAGIAAGSVANEGFNALSNNEPINAGDMAKTAGINTALGLIPYGIGKGLELKGDLNLASELKPAELATEARLNNPTPISTEQPQTLSEYLSGVYNSEPSMQGRQSLQDLQNAYKTPSLNDARKNANQQEYQKLFANVEAPSTPNNMLRAENPSQYFGTTQTDVQAAFPVNSYKFTTGEQRAMNDLTQGMQTAQNYVGHNDVLAAYPPGTTVDQAYADVKANTGVDIPKLADNLVQAQNAKTTLTPEELRMGKVAGVIPDLKPRDTLAPEPVTPTVEQPTQPNIFERKTWTNKDNIPSAGSAPIISITPENVGQLPGGIKPGPGFGKADVTMEPKLQVAAAKIEKPQTSAILEGPVAQGDTNPNYKYVYDPNYDYSTSAKENVSHSDVKSSSQNIIDQYLTDRSANQYAANQLSEDIRSNVKDPLDRMAATVYVQAKGNPELIKARLNGESGFMSDLNRQVSDLQTTINSGKLDPQALNTAQKTLQDYQDQLAKMNPADNVVNLDRNYIQNGKDTGYTYRQILDRALNLNPNAQKWANEALTYTNELGNRSARLGTIDRLEENHLSQSWENPSASLLTPEQLAANKQNALGGKVNLKSSLGTGTNHNAQKTYADYATGIMNGETPRTMDIADIIQREGVDMSRTNATQAFVHQMVQNDVAQAVDRVPDGFKEIAQSGGQKVVVTKPLADALDPILNPNFRRMTSSSLYNDFVNNIKTLNLGMSFFHPKNFVIAGIANGDLRPLVQFSKQMPSILKRMEDPAFRATERDGVMNGLDTTMLHKNLDTNMRLGSDSESIIGKTVNKANSLPVFKQGSKLIEANNKFIFEKMQRFIKVQSYSLKTNSWIGKHPGATEAEVVATKRSIAREVNGVYGGLQWESLGIPRNVLAVMKGSMLSPDWTFSNFDVLRQALNPINHSAGANQARKFLATSVVLGGTFLQLMNYAFSGHGSWGNPKGHELDVQVQPNVYVSPFDGLISDAAKLTGNIVMHGTQGIPEFMQGKLNAPARTAMGLLSGRDYYGKTLADKNGDVGKTEKNVGTFLASNLLPLPFSTQPMLKYFGAGNNAATQDRVTPLGTALLASGIGRYSKNKADNNVFSSPANANAGNWLNRVYTDVTGQGKAQQSLLDNITAQDKAQTTNTTNAKQDAGNMLKAGQAPNIFDFSQKYGIPQSQAKTIINNAKTDLQQSQLSPLAQKFNGMSKTGQKQFLNSLSSADQNTLMNESGIKKK